MNDEASVHLKQLVEQNGLELINNPRRCRGLILDNLVGYRAEANALISALNNGVPAALLSAPTSAPRKATVSALARQLHSDLNMDAQAARWAVESWASALNTTPAFSSQSSAVETEAFKETGAQRENAKRTGANSEERRNNLQPDREGLTEGGSHKQTESQTERKRNNKTKALVSLVVALLLIAAGVWSFVQSRANQPVLVLKGTGEMVKALSWSPDGQRLASADASGGAAIWDASTGKQLVSLKVDNGANLINAAWSPNENRLATGNKDGTVRIWDTSSGKQLLVMGGKSSLASSSDSDFFSQFFSSGVPTSRVLRLAWSPDGKRLAAGHKDGNAEVWDPTAGKVLTFMQPASGSSAPEVDSIAWSRDGQRLAVGYGDGRVIVWDPTSEKQLDTINASQSNGISSSAWSPDGGSLATIDEQGAGEVWDAATGKELLYLNYKGDLISWSLAWSPEGHRLAVGYDDGSVSVWDIQQGKPVQILRGPSPDALDAELLTWSPDGKELAAGQSAGGITVWKVSAAR